MEDQTPPAAPSENSAYAKRPLWQWIALYAVIGVVVYGAIYYFFLAKKGGYTAPAETTPTVETTPVPPTAGPTSSESTVAPTEVSVSLTSAGFSPQALTVKVGTKVTWTNNATSTGNVSSAPHPAHTDYPPLNLGNIPAGGSVSLVFDTPGTYKYHNHLDSSQYGSVTVQ